jgi:Flp pilus assembly protein TadG
MLLKQFRRARRAGAAAVEFAIVAPLFVTILYGLWEVGRVVETQQLVANAAREGGRQGASGSNAQSNVQAAVLAYLTQAGLSTTDSSGNTNVTVTASMVDSSGNVLKDTSGNPVPLTAGQAQMTRFRVTVTYPYANVRWSPGTQFVAANTMLNATTDWYVMSDTPVSVPLTIPSAPLP